MKKLFGTDGIRGYAGRHPMTMEVCLRLSNVLAIKFGNASNRQVIIGKDTRISCDMFEHAIAASLCSFGIDVKLVGVCPTPAISILVQELGASFGIMISASHNNFADNGIKIFNSLGLKLKDDEEIEIESIMDNQDTYCEKSHGNEFGKIEYEPSIIDIYCNKIKGAFEKLKKLKVVVDSSNGSFSKIAPDILNYFGYHVISINDAPNGININDKCGVMYPEIISSKVLECNADVGIAFDGDGDRLLIADENGVIMDGDHILSILVESENINNSEIVSTVMSNYGFEQYLKSRNVNLVRTNVGDRYISEYMQNSPAKIGGEPSGHIIIGEHALTGDGLFAAMKVLQYMEKSNKKASELNSIFRSYPTVCRNINVKNKNVILNKGVSDEVWQLNQQLSNRGKLMMRASGTEPVIRISAEGNDVAELRSMVDKLCVAIENAEQSL